MLLLLLGGWLTTQVAETHTQTLNTSLCHKAPIEESGHGTTQLNEGQHLHFFVAWQLLHASVFRTELFPLGTRFVKAPNGFGSGHIVQLLIFGVYPSKASHYKST
jgi:hypothetical protein